MARGRMGQDVALLRDWAAKHPEGFYYWEACEEFGWTRAYFYRVEHETRRQLEAEGSAEWLVPSPQRWKEPWLYTLSAQHGPLTRRWAKTMMKGMETLMYTILTGARSAQRSALPGSSEAERWARLVRIIEFAREEVRYLLREAM